MKHADNLTNKRSHSGITIYVNNALINFYSKRQNTFESSSFGLGIVVLIIDTKIVESLRYKLSTFVVNLEIPSEVYYDNKPVAKQFSVPVSVLNKRHRAIYYHMVGESQASRTLRVVWISGEYNISASLTKTTITGHMRHEMVDSIFYNKSVVIRDKEKS